MEQLLARYGIADTLIGSVIAHPRAAVSRRHLVPRGRVPGTSSTSQVTSNFSAAGEGRSIQGGLPAVATAATAQSASHYLGGSTRASPSRGSPDNRQPISDVTHKLVVVLVSGAYDNVESSKMRAWRLGGHPVRRITRLGFAILLASAALIPGSSEAACTIDQCFSNADCSQYVCPQGQIALPRCNAISCSYYCHCRTFG